MPHEEEARERSWRVVQAAFAQRQPVERPRDVLRPALLLAAVLAVVVAAFSPPGRAVLGDVKERVVGREHASPALVSLPAPGRLIVYSTEGPWIVQRDGSKRLLDRFDELSWSPRGLYLAASRGHELFAVEPGGKVHWSLARSGRISGARWSGGGNDTRIAYLSGRDLRVVGGDGRGDRLLARNVAPAAPAWLPAAGPHLLSFADRHGGIHTVDVDRPAPLRPARRGKVPTELHWTADSRYLVALADRSLRILSPARRLLRTVPLRLGPHSLAVAPHTAQVAVTQRARGGRSELLVLDLTDGLSVRHVFAATGDFTGVRWSPDGRWLLLAWPSADQWLFVPAGSGRRRIVPVASVGEQFSTSTGRPVFPDLGGWCCATR